jgi:hypothetical protein
MSRNEFEATYKQMSLEQLMHLTTELDDLLPNAKLALMAELRRRGKEQADIDRYATEIKGELSGDEPEAAQAREPRASAEADGDQATKPSSMRTGPVPDDWPRIPGFTMRESIALAAHLDKCGIPYQIVQSAAFSRAPYRVAVPGEQYKACIAALKDYYDLLDEGTEPFTGECPACGTHLERVGTCTSCGLVLMSDPWEIYADHPFVQFLNKNGLGRPPAAAPAEGDPV